MSAIRYLVGDATRPIGDGPKEWMTPRRRAADFREWCRKVVVHGD